jgi:hypothetical protein
VSVLNCFQWNKIIRRITHVSMYENTPNHNSYLYHEDVCEHEYGLQYEAWPSLASMNALKNI